ncbi:MAG TPA: hypothetical protein VI636_14400 [Candidatus Angelobacter sp.]
MRSQLVHSANKRLTNRFMLCRMTSVAAKRMTGTNGHFASSINQALQQIAVLESTVAGPATAPAVAAMNDVLNNYVDMPVSVVP